MQFSLEQREIREKKAHDSPQPKQSLYGIREKAYDNQCPKTLSDIVYSIVEQNRFAKNVETRLAVLKTSPIICSKV